MRGAERPPKNDWKSIQPVITEPEPYIHILILMHYLINFNGII